MRSFHARSIFTSVSIFLFVIVGVGSFGAQVNPRDLPLVSQPQQRFDSGQDVQPIYEGWVRNEDDTFTLHFGYINRNYREQPAIPVGPNNYFSPELEDRGQPTYFYPRTHRFQFEVTVPGTMGTSFGDAVIWTLNHNGSEQKAYGWLQPEWEIDVQTITSNQGMGRGHTQETVYANAVPTVTAEVSSDRVEVGQVVTLRSRLVDDALPPVLPARTPQEPLPTLRRPDNLPSIPDNVQSYSRPRPPRNGLALNWVVHRGPTDTVFVPFGYQRSLEEEVSSPGASGRLGATVEATEKSTSLDGDGITLAVFETTVTFDEPGTYVLRGWGTDSMLMTPVDVTITVTR